MTKKSAQSEDVPSVPEIHDRKSVPEPVGGYIRYPGPLSYPVDQGPGCLNFSRVGHDSSRY